MSKFGTECFCTQEPAINNLSLSWPLREISPGYFRLVWPGETKAETVIDRPFLSGLTFACEIRSR